MCFKSCSSSTTTVSDGFLTKGRTASITKIILSSIWAADLLSTCGHRGSTTNINCSGRGTKMNEKPLLINDNHSHSKQMKMIKNAGKDHTKPHIAHVLMASTRRGALAAVKLLPCDHEVLETASFRNARKGCVHTTQDTKWSDPSPDPVQVGAECTGPPFFFTQATQT
jgi:hypothetical protein